MSCSRLVLCSVPGLGAAILVVGLVEVVAPAVIDAFVARKT